MGRGVPAGSHEGPLQKTLVSLVFLRGRLWNSTGGINVQDADLINTVKILLIHRNPLKTSQNGGFRMVPGGPRPRRSSAGL